jgi:hypothetical protein
MNSENLKMLTIEEINEKGGYKKLQQFLKPYQEKYNIKLNKSRDILIEYYNQIISDIKVEDEQNVEEKQNDNKQIIKEPSSNFRHVKYLNINWIGNKSKSGGAQNKVIMDNGYNNDNIIVVSVSRKHGRLYAAISYDELINLTSCNRNVFEIIYRFPHKVYFDIDAYDEISLDYIKDEILKYFPHAIMNISGSVSDNKISYHVILSNYLIKNEEDREKMKFITKLMGEPFDSKVYTSNRLMKCINQSKHNDNRIQEIIECNDHFITTNLPNSYHNISFELPDLTNVDELKEFNSSSLSVLDYPDLNLPYPSHNLNENIGLLAALPNSEAFDFKYQCFVMRFCYYNNISFDEFWSLFCIKKDDSVDRYNKYSKLWSKCENFNRVDAYAIRLLLSRFIPNFFNEEYYRDFKNLMDVSECETMYINRLDHEEHFNINKKHIICNLSMGMGKTHQSISYINNNKSFIWLTPRRTLARDTYARMLKNDIDVTLYLNAPKNKLFQYKKLIVNAESLHHCSTHYDTVIIDECETLLNCFISKQTHKSNLGFNWETMLKIIHNADKVIYLDAFTSKKTLELIKIIDGHLDNAILYESINKPEQLNITHLKDGDFQTFEHMIGEDLINNKKLFIFYPYKSGNKKRVSIEAFAQSIRDMNKDILVYHGDSNDTVNKTLHNTNESWGNIDCVVTNSKITVGVSYDRFDFDKIYICTSSFCLARDIIQVSRRIRNITEKQIISVYIPSRLLERYCDNMYYSDEYKHMVDLINIERLVSFKESFNYFCDKANYKINQVIKKDDNLEGFINSQDLYFSYDKIEDYTKDTVDIDEIENLIYTENATMAQKLALRKYYFKQKFNDDANIGDMRYLWDNNKLKTTEQYYYYFNAQDNKARLILNSLDIDIDNLDIDYIRTIKLNDIYKETIRNLISTQYKHCSSSDMKFISMLINGYFNCELIKSKKSNGVNTWVLTKSYDTLIDKLKLNIVKRDDLDQHDGDDDYYDDDDYNDD